MKAGKRILVVYYSWSGNTGRVAEDLASRLGAECEKIVDLKNRRGIMGYLSAALDSFRERSAQVNDAGKSPNDYALTIIGTPIWAGKITPAVRAYLRAIHGRCNDVAFFTTSGSTPAEKVVLAMEQLAGRRAVASAGFNLVDLKTPVLYENKLAAFLDELQRDHTCQVCGQEPKYSHA